MKKIIDKAVITVLIVFTLAGLVSCGAKGRTIEVTNGHSAGVFVYVIHEDGSEFSETVAPGEKASFTFNEEGQIAVSANFDDFKVMIPQTFSLEKNKTIKTTVVP